MVVCIFVIPEKENPDKIIKVFYKRISLKHEHIISQQKQVQMINPNVHPDDFLSFNDQENHIYLQVHKECCKQKGNNQTISDFYMAAP
jgi:hypothetical protein